MGKVNVGTALAIWDLVSRVRQCEEDLWEMFVDESSGMINVLELDERSAFAFAKCQ